MGGAPKEGRTPTPSAGATCAAPPIDRGGGGPTIGFFPAAAGPPGHGTPPASCTAMMDAVRKVEALIEAGGYIRLFRGALIVVKLGGSAMEEESSLEATLQDVIFMATAGMR